MALPPGIRNLYSPHFTGKTVVPQGGSGIFQGLSVRRGQSQDSGPRGPGSPTPHYPESRLLGPVSRARLTHSPHVPWLQDPSLSRSGPNCPKSLCQASVPTGPLFAMSPFLRCLRWVPPSLPSSDFAGPLPGPGTHYPWVFCCHHVYK